MHDGLIDAEALRRGLALVSNEPALKSVRDLKLDWKYTEERNFELPRRH
jgi:hypothetical protein